MRFENETKREPLEYFNRYKRRVEIEPVYHEVFLRWSYGTMLGRFSLEWITKHALFSQLYGWWMNRPASRRKILPFIRSYGLDSSEFVSKIEDFRSFNDFFVRRIAAGARPVCKGLDTVVFPADARHLGLNNISRSGRIIAKGKNFVLATLLQSESLADYYCSGSAIISRLSAIDCHRFCFPIAGEATAAKLINGPLYSVNPIALKHNRHVLLQNKRAITHITSEDFGVVTMVEIGATGIGSIRYTYQAGQVEKGQEKGFFSIGGSCIITLFEHDRVLLAADLCEQSNMERELYGQMGDCLGKRKR